VAGRALFPPVLCCAVLCCAVLRYDAPCHPVLCHAVRPEHDLACLCILHVNVMSTGFTALGEMAMALAKVGAHSVMGPLLPRVADQIKEAISVKGRARPNCREALQCVGVLAQALGSTWKTEATSLVQPMMSTGLSQPLVKTLQVIRWVFLAVLLMKIRYLSAQAICCCLPCCLPCPGHIACYIPAISLPCPCHTLPYPCHTLPCPCHIGVGA